MNGPVTSELYWSRLQRPSISWKRGRALDDAKTADHNIEQSHGPIWFEDCPNNDTLNIHIFVCVPIVTLVTTFVCRKCITINKIIYYLYIMRIYRKI